MSASRRSARPCKMGYRHIDTAAFYGNEAEVGEGIRKSGVSRDEIFLTTKVRHCDLAPGDFEASVEASLQRLGMPYVDLLLIHWPNPDIPPPVYIPALCKAKRNGQATHIGVAQFHHGAAGGSRKARRRADRQQPDRDPSFPRSPHHRCRLQGARHFGHRLLPARTRPHSRQRRARTHRQDPRQERGAGRAALARAARE